jgi:hypothetical protein
VRCACAAHNDGKDINHCAWPVVADGVCKGSVFGTYEARCLGEVIVHTSKCYCAEDYFSMTYPHCLHLFIPGRRGKGFFSYGFLAVN